MRDQDPGQPRLKTKNTLLAIDSAIDAGVYSLRQRLRRGWGWFVGRSQDMRVRGAKRGLVETLSESATLGTAGAVLMLALAQPAFKATQDDWRARLDLSVTFQDRNGNEIGKRGIVQTDLVSLSDLPDHLIKAAMAIEDRRFYQHFGIDVLGTFRAIIENARASGVVQGGSSLTQQLAKNLFLSNERTLERKVKEAFLAMWLEANLSKDEILKLYLERAYLGGGTFGVEAASQFYFGKSARDLTLAESAMIAGMFKAPTRYAPHVNLPTARARANVVLDSLVASGFMTEGQVHSARLNPATPVDRRRETSPDYYLDWAFAEAKRLADSGAFGGVRSIIVRTALDPAIQARAEASIEGHLRQFGTQYGVKQAASVTMEPLGAVRALVGGRDYGTSQFNRATNALRQPGSSFKTYVFTAAMMNGYTPDSIVPDAPITIGNWSPRNYNHSYAGRVTLTNSLTRSLNTVSVRLGRAIGLDKVVALAEEMGVTTKLRINRALALGTSEVTVLDQATGYSSLASGGYHIEPYAALEVSDTRGNVIWTHERAKAPLRQVVSPKAVSDMNRILVNVVENGTGRRSIVEGIRSGGKTGTSQNYRDAWFIGFTGDFTTAVWFGNDDYTGTKEMTGGSLPAMVWKEVMQTAQAGIDTPRPIPGVDQDPRTGAAPVVATAPEPQNDPGNGRLSRRATIVLNEIEAEMRRAAGLTVSSAPADALPAGNGVRSQVRYRGEAMPGSSNIRYATGAAGAPAETVARQ